MVYNTQQAPRTGQVGVATTPVCLAGANNYRDSLVITNPSANTVYIGFNNSVTTSTGLGIPTNGALEYTGSSAVWVVSVAGTETVTYAEDSSPQPI